MVESYNLSTELLQNVEALANGETPSQTACIGSGSVDCPIMSDKVRICKSRLWLYVLTELTNE